MTPVELEYRPLRAPQNHAAALVQPAAAAAIKTLASLPAASDRPSVEIGGVSLSDLAQQARRNLIESAARYTFAYREPFELPSATSPIVMGGHQPGLFHPGVWFKNFLLNSVSRAAGAIAVNLIVDADAIASPTISIPERQADGVWRQHRAAYDAASSPIAWEERTVIDRAVFDQFGERTADRISPIVGNPIIASLWPRVLQAVDATGNIGRSFAQARHQLEAAWGLQTLEIPLSLAYSSRSFLRFAAHLWQNASRFAAIYNDAIDEYRQLHKIRSANHPAPHLASEADLVETPLWVWTASDPRRRGLYVGRTSAGVRLTDRGSFDVTISNDVDSAIDALLELEEEVRLRPRALLTTTYARLALSDLFIHGIGGAKYDQVTDLIIARFFGVAPPPIVAATATVHLPIDRTPSATNETARIARLLRDLRFNPDRHLGDLRSEPITELIAKKRRWLAETSPHLQAERHRAIEWVNLALQPALVEQRESLERQLTKSKREARNDAIAFSREYAFSLFPEKSLRSLLLDLSAAAP
ncbi:MAG: hypothetical protein ACIALR_16330 [Blastopirellula sp. JB062]